MAVDIKLANKTKAVPRSYILYIKFMIFTRYKMSYNYYL